MDKLKERRKLIESNIKFLELSLERLQKSTIKGRKSAIYDLNVTITSLEEKLDKTIEAIEEEELLKEFN